MMPTDQSQRPQFAEWRIGQVACVQIKCPVCGGVLVTTSRQLIDQINLGNEVRINCSNQVGGAPCGQLLSVRRSLIVRPT